jgi:hypothetical protein
MASLALPSMSAQVMTTGSPTLCWARSVLGVGVGSSSLTVKGSISNTLRVVAPMRPSCTYAPRAT